MIKSPNVAINWSFVYETVKTVDEKRPAEKGVPDAEQGVTSEDRGNPESECSVRSGLTELTFLFLRTKG